MDIEKFDYDLPEDLIAQSPLKNRSDSRLMVINKRNSKIVDKYFRDVINYLNKGDTLVLNDTKVIPARLIGEKEETHAKIEVLLLKRLENDKWEVLVKPARRLKVGIVVNFSNLLSCKCLEEKDEGIRIVEFKYSGIFEEVLDKLGSMPLPPYIHEKLDDKNRYQTVYASVLGSSAAPTAGLHFTKELLEGIKEKKVNVCYVTLHVGLGTFRPVKENDITKHKMHSEYYELSKETADILNKTRIDGHKIVAVGTTSTRTLESVYKKYGCFKEDKGNTNIFIYPGIKVESIDALITNFHLPKSTLIMLVSAFYDREKVLNAYKMAVDKKYRFFSFGDAMIIGDFDED